MDDAERELEVLVIELQALDQRAKSGERGRNIYRDIHDVRARLDDVAAALEEPKAEDK